MPSRLNRGDIVDQGLQRGAQPAIKQQAREALNRFLEQLYRSYDWPFLLREHEWTTDANSEIDLSAISPEFLSIKELYVDTDKIGPLHQEVRYEVLWAERRQKVKENFTGPVSRFAIDPEGERIVFDPPPNKALSGSMLYFHLPRDINTTDKGDSKKPEWPDAEGLVAFVEAFAHRWRRDNIFTIAEAMKAQAINRVKVMIQQRGRAAPLQVKWSRSFPRKRGN